MKINKIVGLGLSLVLSLSCLVGCSTAYEIQDQESYDKGIERAESKSSTVEIIDEAYKLKKMGAKNEDLIHGMLSVAMEQLDLSEEDKEASIKLFGEEKGEEYINKHKELLTQVKDVYNYPIIDDEVNERLNNVISDLEDLNKDMTENMMFNMFNNIFGVQN